ncbi:MAG: phosphopyruvate hydratase [bacterium]|nr:phosphopyruvate hydratase [bacterium]
MKKTNFKFRIKQIKAREILDSKGDPTVEAILEMNQERFSASVPSGISKGRYEAMELRDKNGGVKKACENIEKIIAPALKGEDPVQQGEIDSILIELDGTENKSRLGANAILAVSMAVCRAGAKAKNLLLWQHIAELTGNKKPKMPIPCFLLLEGGLHGGRRGPFSTQEFMVAIEEGSLSERIAKVRQVYSFLKKMAKAAVGKEGAFAPVLKNSEAAFEIIKGALKRAGIKERLVLDMAASHFFKKGKYIFEGEKLSAEELLRFYKKLVLNYQILGIEDPFSQEDWRGFRETTKDLGKKLLVIGDDLLVTNLELTKKAIKEKACNSIIIKPNQVGTITETIGVANFAKSQGMKLFAKHRGGETKDSFLADLAVGLGADYIAAGGLLQKERLAKYQRLLEIEKELNNG